MTVDIMIDLETLGTAPGSVITTIACAASDESEMTVGISIRDPETLAWWRKQPRETWEAQTSGTQMLAITLALLSGFVKQRRAGDGSTGERIRVWGDGATFDPVLLEAAYRACNMPCPWYYTEVYCYRTLRQLKDSKKPASVTAHDALSDAKAQLKHLQELLAP